MNCDDARAVYMSGDNAPQAVAHIKGCAECRRAVPELDQIRSRLSDPDLWEMPSPELRDRLVDTMAAATAPPVPSPTISTPRRSRRLLAIGAAAAVAVIVAALAVLNPGADDPDWEFALEASDAAPGATATIGGWNEQTGTRLELVVEGLPPAGADAYYALWLTAPDGRHIPAATFSESGTVSGWVAVSRRDFPRVWITLEAIDEDESLSGVKVLDTPST